MVISENQFGFILYYFLYTYFSAFGSTHSVLFVFGSYSSYLIWVWIWIWVESFSLGKFLLGLDIWVSGLNSSRLT